MGRRSGSGTVEWLTPSGRRIWHEGIAPDVPVALPDGVTPLSPDDVKALTAAAVGSMTDTQLAKAIDVVSTQQVATTHRAPHLGGCVERTCQGLTLCGPSPAPSYLDMPSIARMGTRTVTAAPTPGVSGSARRECDP